MQALPWIQLKAIDLADIEPISWLQRPGPQCDILPLGFARQYTFTVEAAREELHGHLKSFHLTVPVERLELVSHVENDFVFSFKVSLKLARQLPACCHRWRGTI